MKFFLDTEFSERGPHYPIQLISIGIVSERNRTLYAESSEVDYGTCNTWVRDNVLNKTVGPRYSLNRIKQDILDLIGVEVPEFWGYYCCAPETRILTSDLRWVDAGSLSEGDRVVGFDEEGEQGEGRSRKWRQWRNATITSTEAADRPCFDLVFDDRTTVRCSQEHRWLTKNTNEGVEWMQTHTLKPGMKIVKPLDVWEPLNTRSAGYLAAAFDGEGHITQKDISESANRGRYRFRIGFSQKQNVMLDTVLELLADTGFEFVKKPRTNKGMYHVIVGRRPYVIKLLGSVRPPRLLSKFKPEHMGSMALRTVKLKSIIPSGVQQVCVLSTDTKTYIAEGLASHNCDYDWVVFCQIFGTMVDLPKGWPMYCNDIKQLCKSLGNPQLPTQSDKDEHHALFDAAWNKKAYEYLVQYGRERGMLSA